eukprot:CAMPEP_0176263460 /NCGR_PEP_ID=MMETSP0121_2-20121125/41136_1 /TAXON_ID=160619 /ORGANISM="Kryptoperidinium foliaceum, Strain CCMP 1326" /LENGTH=75 /DNA_ID=CAMNT_0017603455 /DNA_START=13 /DNA_END=237 /DNA_ORIENTATION=+
MKMEGRYTVEAGLEMNHKRASCRGCPVAWAIGGEAHVWGVQHASQPRRPGGDVRGGEGSPGVGPLFRGRSDVAEG